VRRAVAVDTGAFAPLRGLRAAAGVALVLAIGVAAGQAGTGVLAAVGALTAGTVSLTQGARTPFATMAAAGLALAVSTCVGSLTADTLPAALLALALWGAGAGLLAGGGVAASTVGVQAVVGLVVTGRFPLGPGAALRAAGEVLLGAAVQLLLCAVVRPPARDQAERRSLAALAEALAGWAGGGGRQGARPTADRVETARALLDRRPGWSGAMPLRSLLTGLARARFELSALTVAASRLPPEDRRPVEVLLAAAATDLLALGAALRAGHETDAAGDAALAARLEARLDGGDDPVQHRATALAGQLRAARLSLAAWRKDRPHAADLLRAAHPLRAAVVPRAVREAVRHPAGAAWRHALRLAVLLPLAEGVVRVLPLQRGYWVALTVVVVLKPDFATSVQRGLGRVLGTLLGVVPVSLVVGLLHPRGAGLIVLVGALAWAAYASFPAGFALFSGFLAGLVVVLLDVVSPGGASVAGDRALDTVIGGALALLAYLALPSWEGPRLPEAVARLVEAEDAYAGRLLRAFGDAPARPEELGASARSVRSARIALEAAVGRAEAEPGLLAGNAAGLRSRVARDALAATSRVVAGLHVLHAQAAEGADGTAPADQVAAVADAVHALLADTARAARTGSPLGIVPDLRAIAAPLVHVPPGSGPVRLLLATEVDELVDAVDTLRFTLALRPSGHP